MKQYNAKGIKGCVQRSTVRKAHTIVTIYRCDQIDPLVTSITPVMEDWPWALVCGEHGTELGVNSLSLAKDFSTTPHEWCDQCEVKT